jgi:hypothetical protein
MGRISCPQFIGRAEESQALDTALERAAAGGAPTVLIGGEAGIGKSRVDEELSRRAAARGARVLAGGCAPFGGSTAPLAPVVEALRSFTRAAGRTPASSCSDRRRRSSGCCRSWRRRARLSRRRASSPARASCSSRCWRRSARLRRSGRWS